MKYGPSIPTNNLVLCLDAADKNSYSGSGILWYDVSGNNNNGTLTNGPTFNSSNQGNIVLDGTNDYVDCGTSSLLNITSSLSVNIWTYLTSTPSAIYNPSFVDKWDWINNKRSFVLGTEAGSSSAYISYDGLFDNRIVCYGTAPSLNIWENYLMTYDGQTLRLYKNGSFITSSAFNQTRNIYDNLSTNVFLGRSRGTEGSVRYITGKISNVQICNRALSATEILQMYNATKGRFGL